MLTGKMFDSPEGRKIQVIEDDGIIVTVSGGRKFRRDDFLTSHSEVITTDNFFKSSTTDLASIARNLANVDPSKVSDADTGIRIRKLDDPSAGVISSNTVERKDLYENFLQRQQQVNPNDYRQIDDEDAAAESLLRRSQQAPPQPRPIHNEPIDDINRYIPQQPQQRTIQPQQQYQETYIPPVVQEQSPEEEAYKFFRGFKKNYDAYINLKFVQKIAKPDFLKMMADNYEADIVKYYTKEIINDIYSNPQRLEEMIYDELNKIIFDEEKESKKIPPPPEPPEDRIIKEGKKIPPPPEPPPPRLLVEGKEPPKPKRLKKIIKDD